MYSIKYIQQYTCVFCLVVNCKVNFQISSNCCVQSKWATVLSFNCFQMAFLFKPKIKEKSHFLISFSNNNKTFHSWKRKITWSCAILKRTNELLLCYLLSISFEKHFLFSLNMIFLVISLVSVIFVEIILVQNSPWDQIASYFSCWTNKHNGYSNYPLNHAYHPYLGYFEFFWTISVCESYQVYRSQHTFSFTVLSKESSNFFNRYNPSIELYFHVNHWFDLFYDKIYSFYIF